MSIPQQVAPSSFEFKPPKVIIKKKSINPDKEKWMDTKPFFGGFAAQTKNQHPTISNPKGQNLSTKAGGFRPPEMGNKEKKNDEHPNLIIFNSANEKNTSHRASIRINGNQSGSAKKKMRTTTKAGGFKVNIKKKSKLDDLKNLKNIGDDHDRCAADPMIKEIIQDDEEADDLAEVIPHKRFSASLPKKLTTKAKKESIPDYTDKSIGEIIPAKDLQKLKQQKVHKIQGPLFEEVKPDKGDNAIKPDPFPTSRIENILNKYSEDIAEEEEYYKTKLKEKEDDKKKKEISLETLTKLMAHQRPVLQTTFEPVMPHDTKKQKAKEEEEWLYAYRNEEYYVQKRKELEELEKKKSEGKGTNLGGGFSKSFKTSHKSDTKRNLSGQKAGGSPNSKGHLNSRTAAQLDRLANINLEASKQDMVIDKMYAEIQEKKKIDQEGQKQKKVIKDKVKREKPTPNVPKTGLYSVNNWITQIEETDPEKLKKNITQKKAGAKKVTQTVERLTQPKNAKPKKDPSQQELWAILSKYGNAEKIIGRGGKQSQKFKNPALVQKTPSPVKNNTNLKAKKSEGVSYESPEIEGQKYQLSKINEEEMRIKEENKLLDTLITTQIHTEASKLSDRFSIDDNVRDKKLSDQDDNSSIDFDENNDELPEKEENKSTLEEESVKIRNVLNFVKKRVNPSDKKAAMRSSMDSLNDRTSLNKDLAMVDDLSEMSERDIDLEDQYAQMQQKQSNLIKESSQDSYSDIDSLNDVDEDFQGI
ncbi:unnamed protein product [Moneuplotes crassus]|uniref:Uncharacterized protein n=1 Tax=Euplotes crassus TaxID=5936 RepID=A0AAD1Y8B8_EUPCR|nr:unnamed protein product [Moneuplotes crassus]